jgi:hypothetical protein
MVSSARFALSVHNTASGVYSVALGSTAPTTTITGANAIAAGWLEAALTALDHAGSTVLLSIADEPVPAVFRGPAQPVGVAAAFLLAAVPAAAPAAASAAAGDRRVELAVVPAIGEPEVNPLDVLARAADGWAREDAAAVALGRIQPGAALELRFPAKDARA